MTSSVICRYTHHHHHHHKSIPQMIICVTNLNNLILLPKYVQVLPFPGLKCSFSSSTPEITIVIPEEGPVTFLEDSRYLSDFIPWGRDQGGQDARGVGGKG